MEFVSIEELVRKDHLLRKIDKVINFGIIRDRVKDLYCADNGRPAIDPVVLFMVQDAEPYHAYFTGKSEVLSPGNAFFGEDCDVVPVG